METEMILRRNIAGFIFSVLFFLPCFSQTDSLISKEVVPSGLRVSYNSSIIYAGIRLGVELPAYSINLIRNTTAGELKAISKDRFIAVNAGWYHHPDFHDNMYFTVEWTMRRKREKGFFTEFSSGLGYSRTYLGATTYRVDNNGNIDIIKSAGYNYAMIITSGGFGYDFSKKKKMPFSVFYKFDLMGMFPYNSTLYFRPAMELGMIYKPANFLKIKTNTRTVSK